VWLRSLQGFEAFKEACVGSARYADGFIFPGFPSRDVLGRAAEDIGDLCGGQASGFAQSYAFAERGQGCALGG
jgi:hypothetical protein